MPPGYHEKTVSILETKARGDGRARTVIVNNDGLSLERIIRTTGKLSPSRTIRIERDFISRPLEPSYGSAVERHQVTFNIPGKGIKHGPLSSYKPGEKVSIETYRNEHGVVVRREATSWEWRPLAKTTTKTKTIKEKVFAPDFSWQATIRREVRVDRELKAVVKQLPVRQSKAKKAN